MRKSGWAAAAGLGSLVLPPAACGGSPSSSSTLGAASTQTTAVSSSSAATTPTSGSASAKAKGKATPTSGTSTRQAPEPRASGNAEVSFPPIGTTVMIVQMSKLGYVLAEANGQVVYTYEKDSRGGSPTCTGSCAAVWGPATGMPKAGPADTFPGTFGLVTGAGGVKQITYNGYPLYLFKGAPPLAVTGDGIDGVWHVIKLSASDISG
jgi:predicted lipoprotein with Yx(FWY)xxD motif